MTVPANIQETQDPLTLDDALETISVAVALGLTVPAPEGTVVYEAVINTKESFCIGMYSSEAAAWNALRDYVVSRWVTSRWTPWHPALSRNRLSTTPSILIDYSDEEYDTLMQAWLAPRTIPEILDAYEDGAAGVTTVIIQDNASGTAWYLPDRPTPYLPRNM